MTTTISPYVVLGLPFGADETAARAAHAQRRHKTPGAWSEAQIDAALDEIIAAGAHPEIRLDWFRVPLESEPYAPPQGAGIFRPPPEPLPRRTAAAAPAERWELAQAVRTAAVHAVAADLGATLGLPPLYPPPNSWG